MKTVQDFLLQVRKTDEWLRLDDRTVLYEERQDACLSHTYEVVDGFVQHVGVLSEFGVIRG